VLAPLELARLGWGTRMLGGLYVVMAGLEAVVHPLLGRWADRRGYREPVATGLAASTAVLLAFAFTNTAWPLAALVVLGGLAFGATLVPGMALLSKTGESLGLGGPQSLALTNFAWALGNGVGAPLGGYVAERAGDAVTYVLLAAVCLGALAWLKRPAAVPASARGG
jgi:predicted MFS family arabinose efflux permease